MSADQQPPASSTSTFRGGSFPSTGEQRTSNSSSNINHGSSNNLSQPNNASGDKSMPRNTSSNSLEERNNRLGAATAPGVSSANSNANNSGNSGWKSTSNPRSSQPLQGPHQYRQGQSGGYQYAQGDYQGSQGLHRASRGQSEGMSRGEHSLFCVWSVCICACAASFLCASALVRSDVGITNCSHHRFILSFH